MNIFDQFETMLCQAVLDAPPGKRKRAEIARDMGQALLKHINDGQLVSGGPEKAMDRMDDITKGASMALGMSIAIAAIGRFEDRYELYDILLKDADEFAIMFHKILMTTVQKAAESGDRDANRALGRIRSGVN